MNPGKKFIIFIFILSILVTTFINLKNQSKVSFYFFTAKIEKITLGNLITLSIIAGYSFSNLMTLLVYSEKKINLKINDNDTKFIGNEEKAREFGNDNENIFIRPPERDIRDSQPTISVNYRFVDKNDSSFKPDNSDNELEREGINNDDWINSRDDW